MSASMCTHSLAVNFPMSSLALEQARILGKAIGTEPNCPRTALRGQLFVAEILRQIPHIQGITWRQAQGALVCSSDMPITRHGVDEFQIRFHVANDSSAA